MYRPYIPSVRPSDCSCVPPPSVRPSVRLRIEWKPLFPICRGLFFVRLFLGRLLCSCVFALHATLLRLVLGSSWNRRRCGHNKNVDCMHVCTHRGVLQHTWLSAVLDGMFVSRPLRLPAAETIGMVALISEANSCRWRPEPHQETGHAHTYASYKYVGLHICMKVCMYVCMYSHGLHGCAKDFSGWWAWCSGGL